jgi:hypothetical protein
MTEMKAKKLSNDHELPAELVSKWREQVVRQGQRAEEFWHKQRIGIRARIYARDVRRPRSLWLSAVTAAVIFVVVLLVTPTGPRPERVPPRATLDADQELLLAIERSLAAGTPEALQPLTLLVESSTSNNEMESISHKEHGHEN